jgi:fucose permease
VIASGSPTSGAIASTTTVGLIAGSLGAIGLIDGGGGGVWTDVLQSFGLSDSTLGPAFATQSGFVFPVLLLGGLLLSHLGMRMMLAIGAAMLAIASFAFTQLDGIVIFIILFAIRGTGLAMLDLTGNTMAMEVERKTGKHIMGIVHAGFSIGVVLGSLIAFAVYAAGGSFRVIHGLLGLLMVPIVLCGLFGPVPPASADLPQQKITVAAFRTPLVRICAICLGLAFGAELLISQFVAVLLRTRIEASDTTSVLAVVVYATMMAAGRFGNSFFINRHDPKALVFVQGVILAIGGVILATSTNVAATLIGSLVGGLGVAGIVPTVLSYAAAHTRASPGETASASLVGGYMGALIMPLMAGGLTSIFSIRAGIALVGVAGLLTIWCGYLLLIDERSANRVARRLGAPGH